MKLYFISGLGADERVFKNIIFPENYEIIYLPWIDPIKHETLSAYSLRLGERIDNSQPFALLGLSMGGMVATEINKIKPATPLILLSSVPTAAELPAAYKYFYRLHLHRWVPSSIFKNASILKKYFGAYSVQNRKLLCTVIRESSDEFIRWAIPAIAGWENTACPSHYYHIHGTKDNVLPFELTHPTHAIKNGRHFMVLEAATEVNKILEEILGSK